MEGLRRTCQYASVPSVLEAQLTPADRQALRRNKNAESLLVRAVPSELFFKAVSMAGDFLRWYQIADSENDMGASFFNIAI